MSAYLDELYFEWLYSQVASIKLKNPRRTYYKLFRILFTTEFQWFVPNDDNRVEDGKGLRYECLDYNDIDYRDVDQDWLTLNCSYFELLVGLARRLAFLLSGDTDECFWELLENIDLRKYNDHEHIPRREVMEILDRVMWRSYRANGKGGLFPLRRPRGNQRNVELWYQMNAYAQERS